MGNRQGINSQRELAQHISSTRRDFLRLAIGAAGAGHAAYGQFSQLTIPRSRKAVVVSRPGRWGNPWKVSDSLSREAAVARYRAALLGGRLDITVTEVRAKLGGHNLAC